MLAAAGLAGGVYVPNTGASTVEREGAACAYETAIRLRANAVERAELERRLQDL